MYINGSKKFYARTLILDVCAHKMTLFHGRDKIFIADTRWDVVNNLVRERSGKSRFRLQKRTRPVLRSLKTIYNQLFHSEHGEEPIPDSMTPAVTLAMTEAAKDPAIYLQQLSSGQPTAAQTIAAISILDTHHVQFRAMGVGELNRAVPGTDGKAFAVVHMVSTAEVEAIHRTPNDQTTLEFMRCDLAKRMQQEREFEFSWGERATPY